MDEDCPKKIMMKDLPLAPVFHVISFYRHYLQCHFRLKLA